MPPRQSTELGGALEQCFVEKSETQTASDWKHWVQKYGKETDLHLVLQEGIVDEDEPLEVASQLVKWSGPFLVNAPDTPGFRTALAKIGAPYLLTDEKSKGRIYLAHVPPAGVELIGKEAPPPPVVVAIETVKPEPAVVKPDAAIEKSFAVRYLSKKESEDERIVYGVVLVPDDTDTQKDTYNALEIQKSCYLFMEEYGHFKIQHKGEFVDGSLVTLENFLAPVDYEQAGPDGEIQKIKKGTWIHGARVNDGDLWESVKKGDFTGWSIGGWSKFEKP